MILVLARIGNTCNPDSQNMKVRQLMAEEFGSANGILDSETRIGPDSLHAYAHQSSSWQWSYLNSIPKRH